MKISELKRIAEENNYEYWELENLHVFTKKYTNYFISISKNKEKRIWVKTPMMCDDKDFNMTKAVVEFAETPPEDREGEKDKENRPNWMTRWLGEPVRDCEVEVEE